MTTKTKSDSARRLTKRQRVSIELALRVHRGVGYPKELFKAMESPASHPCMSSFWGVFGQQLALRLDAMRVKKGPGFACRMVPATYSILCTVQTEIERAVGAPHVDPAPRVPGSIDDDAWLRTRAQFFLSALMEDEFDGGPHHHLTGAPKWMAETGLAEAGAVNFLFAPPGRGPSGPPSPTHDLLGRVRNALGG